jgi:hypothetical protein
MPLDSECIAVPLNYFEENICIISRAGNGCTCHLLSSSALHFEEAIPMALNIHVGIN